MLDTNISTNFEDLTNEQKEFIVQWLQDNFVLVKSINRQHSAYGLKQKFTRLNFYVTKEQFTEAMIRAGFTAVEKELDKGIYCFNIGQSSPFFKLR